jgi:hypothetical protein
VSIVVDEFVHAKVDILFLLLFVLFCNLFDLYARFLILLGGLFVSEVEDCCLGVLL